MSTKLILYLVIMNVSITVNVQFFLSSVLKDDLFFDSKNDS